MGTLIVVEGKELCPVPVQGIFTVPTEDALVKCNCPGDCAGLLLPQVPLAARQFQLHAYQLQDLLIERQRARGRQLHGEIRLHGPFPSYDFNQHLVDVKASMWSEAMRPDSNGDEHPELVLGAVFERERAFGPYCDYVYMATFLGYEYTTRQSVEGGLPVGN